MALVFRTWFNRPSQTLRETNSTDTGKEVVARLIHRASPRKHGPFVAINCAALPEQRAARRLGLTRTQLYGRLKRYIGIAWQTESIRWHCPREKFVAHVEAATISSRN